MEVRQSDFAPPAAKTVGCLIAVIAFPVVCALHVFSTKPMPLIAFFLASTFSLYGLAVLCARSVPWRSRANRRAA